MAELVSGNKIKMDDGRTITPDNGGWYDGRRYLDGRLLAPGEHEAGKVVSNEVIAQTNPANVPYVAQKRADFNRSPSPTAPASAEQLPAYLDSYQNETYKGLTVPDLKVPTAEELKANLTPSTPAPELLNRTALLEQQRAAYGVADLETELNTLKTEEREILATLRETTGAEEGKPVALGVMAGRIGEEQRQAQTKLDYLNVRKATIVDELTTKYNAINTFINYAGLDYQDAVKAYEGEFARNVEVQNMLSGFRKEAWTYATDAIKLNETIKQNQIDNSRANLTTITNAITSGNMNYDSLSSDTKLQIQKLEIQSGLPIGTVGGLQLSAKDKILGWSDDKTQVMVSDGNGGLKLVNTGFKKSSGTTKLSATQINEGKQKVIKLGGSAEDQKKIETDIDYYNWVMAQPDPEKDIKY